MAKGIASTSGADIGIATTGIAGPGGGTEEKPVGLVYIAVYYNNEVEVRKLNLSGNRQRVRERAATAVIDMVRRKLL